MRIVDGSRAYTQIPPLRLLCASAPLRETSADDEPIACLFAVTTALAQGPADVGGAPTGRGDSGGGGESGGEDPPAAAPPPAPAPKPPASPSTPAKPPADAPPVEAPAAPAPNPDNINASDDPFAAPPGGLNPGGNLDVMRDAFNQATRPWSHLDQYDFTECVETSEILLLEGTIRGLQEALRNADPNSSEATEMRNTLNRARDRLQGLLNDCLRDGKLQPKPPIPMNAGAGQQSAQTPKGPQFPGLVAVKSPTGWRIIRALPPRVIKPFGHHDVPPEGPRVGEPDKNVPGAEGKPPKAKEYPWTPCLKKIKEKEEDLKRIERRKKELGEKYKVPTTAPEPGKPFPVMDPGYLLEMKELSDYEGQVREAYNKAVKECAELMGIP